MRSQERAITPARSGDLDGNSSGKRCERLEVGSISGQHGSTGLGERHDERVDR